MASNWKSCSECKEPLDRFDVRRINRPDLCRRCNRNIIYEPEQSNTTSSGGDFAQRSKISEEAS